MNQTAINFWLLGGSVGYLIGSTLYSMVIGFTVVLAISFMVDIVYNQ